MRFFDPKHGGNMQIAGSAAAVAYAGYRGGMEGVAKCVAALTVGTVARAALIYAFPAGGMAYSVASWGFSLATSTPTQDPFQYPIPNETPPNTCDLTYQCCVLATEKLPAILAFPAKALCWATRAWCLHKRRDFV